MWSCAHDKQLNTLTYRFVLFAQIWNSNVVKDEFMGQVQITATSQEAGKMYEMDLTDRKDKKTERRPGKLWVQVTSSPNLASI